MRNTVSNSRYYYYAPHSQREPLLSLVHSSPHITLPLQVIFFLLKANFSLCMFQRDSSETSSQSSSFLYFDLPRAPSTPHYHKMSFETYHNSGPGVAWKGFFLFCFVYWYSQVRQNPRLVFLDLLFDIVFFWNPKVWRLISTDIGTEIGNGLAKLTDESHQRFGNSLTKACLKRTRKWGGGPNPWVPRHTWVALQGCRQPIPLLVKQNTKFYLKPRRPYRESMSSSL